MRFSSLGDSAIVVACGDEITIETLRRVRQFANAIAQAGRPGITDIVPAFTTVTVFYDAVRIGDGTEPPQAVLSKFLAGLSTEPPPESISAIENEVAIPVCYETDFAPDLAAVAEHAGLPIDEVIRLHSEASYLVQAIGFSPGFPYLGGLSPQLETPRLGTPRIRVEAGSVGIGGAQTGVYPLASPGGWQLIGRTPLRLFDFTRRPPALLRIGDRVKFNAITAEQLAAARDANLQAAAAKSDASDDPSATGVRVLRAGMLTTVQDLGRAGFRADGVPVGGAADGVALRVANWLVGNPGEAAGLEFTLVGPELEFTADAVIALGAATFEGMPPWKPVAVAAGTRIRFGAAREGCRGYLAVAGGFKVEHVLGSASTYLRAAFGGFAGRALREGDQLSWHDRPRRVSEGWRIDERVLPAYSNSPTLRVVRGAQAEVLLDGLLAAEFTVTQRSDRMGLRLSGPPLNRGQLGELISAAVAPGTIQIPPDGQPILLLADAQTIGGYPQAAHVITVDLPLAAQLKAGDRVRFREVSLDEAQRLLLAREHALAILHEGLTQKIL